MWIGLLYYFNFVQVPALAEAAKKTTPAPESPSMLRRVRFSIFAGLRW